MKIIRQPSRMFKISQQLKSKGCSIGLVPTMGALHEGHLSLIRQAVKENDKVVVSIFVNPIQFGPREDFSRYPRDIKKDAALCRKEKTDFIFYPDTKAMYPEDFETHVRVAELSDLLCGAFRPGHFQGVTTVVTKLFNIVGPDRAYFGQKDAQQAIIIQRMVRDLNMPVKIRVMPIVRQKDGLAMSSRNQYLNEEERTRAVILYNGLNKAKVMVKQGIRDSKNIIQEVKKVITKIKPKKIDTFGDPAKCGVALPSLRSGLSKDTEAKSKCSINTEYTPDKFRKQTPMLAIGVYECVDYISIVDLDNLKPIERIKDRALLALAVWIGNTRLIDNTILKV